MTCTIKAIYENGLLKLEQPLPLMDHEEVQVTIQAEGGWAQRTYGMMGWTGDSETLHRIAEDPEFGILESP